MIRSYIFNDLFSLVFIGMVTRKLEQKNVINLLCILKIVKISVLYCRYKMEKEVVEDGEFSFASKTSNIVARGGKGLAKIQTQKKANEVCHDDSTPPVKAQTIDELHSLQRKKSTPTTPIKGTGFFTAISEEERQRQQLQSIRYKSKKKKNIITIWP